MLFGRIKCDIRKVKCVAAQDTILYGNSLFDIRKIKCDSWKLDDIVPQFLGERCFLLVYLSGHF